MRMQHDKNMQLSSSCARKLRLLAIYGNLFSFSQNIANKNMQDVYYSETSPSNTGWTILIVQSWDVLTCI